MYKYHEGESSTLRSRIDAPLLKKSNPSPLLAVIRTHLLINFEFSRLDPKKIEQCKTYLSIRKSNQCYF